MGRASHDAPTLDPVRVTLTADSAWARLPLWAGLAGGLGVGASALLGMGNPRQFYFSWLVSFLFWLSIALGGMCFVLAHFLARAGWGVVVRRGAEKAMAVVPLCALLFVPVWLGRRELFSWTAADAAHDEVLAGKAPFLNEGFFLVRALIYFVLWSLIALYYARGSSRQDKSGDPAVSRRLLAGSGPAMFAFAITVTFASIDWVMSLDPHWYSTMFGVYFFAGCLIGVFAFLALFTILATRAGYLRGIVTPEHLHDLGKLLFAFTVFWAYIAFCQFFLVWYGNMPEETIWYLERFRGGWLGVAILLAVGHFGIPFFYLMPRTIKRNPSLLAAGAAWLLGMHFVDLYWQVMPVLHHELHPSLLDLTCLVGIGGLFLAAVGWSLRGEALVPLRDPRLPESLSLENV